MTYPMRLKLPLLALATIPVAVVASLPGVDKRDFTDEFVCESGQFATETGPGAHNQYFPLVVGSESVLNNAACFAEGECEELEQVVITVLDETEVVGNVTTRVVEEYETVDGEVEEISRNFFAVCEGSGDVFYFGEDVLDGDGELLPDGWRAGNGNRAGLIMPGGTFLIGARYFQEVAPDVALDRGEHVERGLSFDNPGPFGAGLLEDCVLVHDTNALEDPKGKEIDEKVYCPGVGLVQDEDLELVSITRP